MLPESFKERMKNILGEDYENFINELECGNAVRGARINTLKCSVADFKSKTELPLSEIPYTSDGFILESDIPVGALPEHHAGLIYMQDPGAMASLSSVDIPLGARVLDMCAAPGGKSGQAAARIGESGLLISNEYVAKRAKIMVGNFERLGIRNAFITSLDTSEFPKLFRDYFDIVIVDAPCSGEGMFRKNSEAIEEWSEENVLISARRQREILSNAARVCRPGGYIIYSTCTYSIDENEATVYDFLLTNGNFRIAGVTDELKRRTADGIPYKGMEELKLTRRFYPHLSRGEGQYIALLKREDDGKTPTILYKDKSKPLTREESATVAKFFKETLTEPPDAELRKVGENIVLIPHGFPVMPNSVFLTGVLLGEIRKGILTPSHQFFSAYGSLFKRKAELESDALFRYLCGEEIENTGLDSGYAVITYHGAPLGGGKAVSDRIKNHYPKGLRNHR